MYKAITVAVLLAFSITAAAQERTFRNEFGFISDNDSYLFYGQDRYYTNGLFIFFRRANDQEKLGDKLEKTILEISVGQKMYNAQSGNRPNPATHDRPFAGYLYGSGAFSWLYKNESAIKAELQVGTLGPGALGEDGQKLLHDLVGFYEIDGWQYQIRDGLAVNAMLKYMRKIHRSSDNVTDFSVEGNLNVGTVFSGAGAGILFRAGKIEQLFNSATLNARIGKNSQTRNLHQREFFFYAKPYLSYVAYDATVQGSLFNDDSPVTFGIKPVVFSQQLGLNYSTPRFTLDYGMTFRSREIKSNARPHQFGSISMYYRFN